MGHTNIPIKSPGIKLKGNLSFYQLYLSTSVIFNNNQENNGVCEKGGPSFPLISGSSEEVLTYFQTISVGSRNECFENY